MRCVLAFCAAAALFHAPSLLAQSLPAAAPSAPAPAAAGTAAQPGGGTAAQPGAGSRLPVRRVVLFKNGVGFFEHLGRITGNRSLTIDFTSAQLDDVLKSLTVLDLGDGRIGGVSFNSDAPLDRRLGGLRLPIGTDPSLVEFLGALRGARVTVSRGAQRIGGRLLSVDRGTPSSTDRPGSPDTASIVGDAGDVHTFELGPGTVVTLGEAELRDRVSRYLELMASMRDEDRRRMTITARGSGARDLYVSYISEVPVWKTTYRLVLPDAASAKATLQGWAIVDNTVGEDWESVQLALVAGAPQSFIQQLSQPYYTRRPVVPLPDALLPTPQTHAGAMTIGPGTLTGVVSASGALLPGVTVRAAGPGGERVVITDASGSFRISDLPAGTYTVTFDLAGFDTRTETVAVGAAQTRSLNVALDLGALSETVTVELGSGGGGGGTVGGVVGGIPEPPPPPPAVQLHRRAAAMAPAADVRELGDLFEYKVRDPVTIRQNQSALVPIVQASVEAEKVSLWTSGTGSGRPLRAVRFTNTTDLTLDGGSIVVLESDTFAGEGLIEPLKAGEKRLVSYATDLGVMVDAGSTAGPRQVSRLRATKGVLIQEVQLCSRQVYTVRNEDATPRSMVIEHPLRAGWKLLPGSPPPVETTPTAHRFALTANPGMTAPLEVAEARSVESRYQLADTTGDQLTLFVRDTKLPESAERMLQDLMRRQSDLARIDVDIEQRESQVATIGKDQTRLRENMRALKGSAEEKRLTERYVGQLNEQEDRLESLQGELASLAERRQQTRAELREVVEKIVFDSGESMAGCPES